MTARQAGVDKSAACAGRASRHDFLAALFVVTAVAVELAIREAFFRISSQAPGLLTSALLALIAVAGWCRARRHEAPRWLAWCGRVCFVVSSAAWVWFCGIRSPLGSGTALAVLVVGAATAAAMGESRWALLRRAVTAAALIFVLSQPLLAMWRAPSGVTWPAASTAGSRLGTGPEITVVVLLDELSASAAGPIAEAMGRSGHPVLRRALAPVGDGTAKVVPALLAHRAFVEAKPCGWHVICSGASALDLERISASRPDVDVVGFYMPYCAIRGLRSCEVLSPKQPYLDPSRWRCAAQRRSERLARWDGEDERARCARMNGEVWADLGQRVIDATWRMPVWSQGGFLYVHAPMPHPPGDGGTGTLEQHYRANIAKAAEFVGDMAQRLSRQSRSFSLIVFSDHPLRSAFWCRSTQYSAHCPPAEELLDEHVPLLATGVVPSELTTLQSNLDLFPALDGALGEAAAP